MYRAQYLTCLLLAAVLAATAQNATPVIQAERSFASHAADHGVRDAFLTFTDSTAIAMENGQYLNALAQWRQQPDSKIMLQWGPQFAGASADGASGFTTGPYYMRHPGADTLLGAGQYTTFWKKNSAGEWKYLIDFGIQYPKRHYKAPDAEPQTVTVTPDPEANATAVEDAFLQRYKKEGIAAYAAFLHSLSWLNLNRSRPAGGADNFGELISKMPSAPQFEPVGYGISGGKDMAYVYGNLVYEGRRAHYLRIWGHTPEGWKILVQVMQ